MSERQINKKIKKQCSVCNKSIKVILYADRTYRNGHYFGNLAGRKEYWECSKCYWGK